MFMITFLKGSCKSSEKTGANISINHKIKYIFTFGGTNNNEYLLKLDQLFQDR